MLLLCGAAHAQGWPTRPVTVHFNNSPGSSPDIVIRALGERLSRSLGQPIVIVNQTGGNGIPPMLTVMRSKPDGYSLLFAGNSQLSAHVFLVKDLPYDPEKDFAPIAMVVDSAPFVISAHPRIKANTLSELIALAKAEPGKLTYGVSGSLSPILGQLLNQVAGINIVQVPYKDSIQSVQETVGGVTDLNYNALPTLEPFHRAGKIKYLAVTSRKRFPVIPDVPAIAETLPGFSIDGWFVMLGPAGTPQPVIARLNRDIDTALRDPELQQRMASFGFASSGAQTPDGARAFIRAERDNWERIVKTLGLQPQ